ncbi:MAG TPA: glycoside hydrolase family 3 C-terminal domain-containing protein [Verrucomicrobiae bacterium]|nr:glycoside hydrolase family 3 C-terminal domain-containing protein [Verrucomicrobiae bacterium]
MHRIILCALVMLASCFSTFTAWSGEEACVACNRSVWVSGQFTHGWVHGIVTIDGAPPGMAEAFREAISGPHFTVTVSNLPPGKYVARLGMVETVYTNAGQRVFDVTCGQQTLASNLDLFVAAGGVGKAYFVTGQVDQTGVTMGSLTFDFLGQTNDAELNTFELEDAAGTSLVSLRAADLLEVNGVAALQAPVITGPLYWKDPSLPMSTRVNDLIRRMSLAEKVQQLRNDAPAMPRLGVPAYNYWNECLHGVARAGVATVFPQAIGMAATWDTPLVHQEANVIAVEARAKHNEYVLTHGGNCAQYYGLTFWTPNINIFRDPRWGRGQETYGEDPFLTASLGVAFIRGLQGDDPKYLEAVACAKHYAVHSGPEPERHSFNVDPTDRDLHETYLPQFEAAVREGHVGGVMGAYNSVDGEPACANPYLLTDLLRKQWGFDGYVTSDCGAIYDIWANHKFVGTPEAAAAVAVKAGDDLCCGTDYNALVLAVRKGLISESKIDQALGYLLQIRFRLGMFDPPASVPYSKILFSENNSPEHQALALRVARESMVLLKNDGLLPLDRAKIKRIAVIGVNANSVPMLLGNYNGTPSNPITILEGIRNAAGADIDVVYQPGCPLALSKDGSNQPDAAMTAAAVSAAKSADVVVYVGGISAQLEGEEMTRANGFVGFSGGDRTEIELPSVQTDLLKALYDTGKPVVFVDCSGSAIAMPWAAKKLPAILQAWYPGEAGGQAVAEVLFGDVNPAGRLPVTFYRSTTDLPPFDDYSMSNRTYRYFNGQPLFAFGHGLSYTRFQYSAARLDASKVAAGDTLKLAFNLRNAGTRDGDEVAQVYFRHVNSALPQAKLALCGFVRIHLPQDGVARVALDIPVERFRYWDTAHQQYTVEPGKYELLIGAASDDIRLHVPFEVSPPALAAAR